MAWAIREGDGEIGITFHRMDAGFDTGPILAQRRYPLGEPKLPEVFYPAFGLTGEDAWLDLSRPAAEVHRLA